MSMTKIKDTYNNNKVWHVKRSKCGHYYLNQSNGDNMLNTRFIRVTKKYLIDLGLSL
jgi:hypothetical protein